jgi:hypothetical protein
MGNDRISTQVRELAEQLPLGWECWAGVAGLLYARRRKSTPPIVVRGVTVAEVVAKVAEQEAERQ